MISGYGNLQLMLATGSYLASEFSGSNSAANLKDSISGQCPLETAELLKSRRSIRGKSVVSVHIPTVRRNQQAYHAEPSMTSAIYPW
jgi:hypothetical protein